MRRTPAWACALLLALLAAPLLATQATAHALPVQVAPESGAVVKVPPREVWIRFTEGLDPAYSRIEVKHANGTVVSQPSTIDADGLTMRAALPAELDYGAYSIVWRALSTVDGHSTKGLSAFLWPDPAKPLNLSDIPGAEAQTEVLVGPQDLLLRGLAFLGLFAILGSATLLLGVVGPDGPGAPWPPERRLGALALGGGILGAVATVAMSASSGAAAAGVPFTAALLDPALAFTGRFGQLAGLRAPLLLGAGLLAFAGAREGRASRRGLALWAASAGVAALAFATVSLSSHAAALRGWTAPAIAADWIHQVASAAWVGGVAGLAWVLWGQASREPGRPWAAMAGRFSAIATASVGAVVLTGVAATLLHAPGLRGLLASAWGQVLLAKLALVAGLLAFGAYNKFRLVPAMLRAGGDGGEAGARFGRSLRGEAVLGVAVILVAGGLSALSPPAADAGQAPGGAQSVLELRAQEEGVNVTLLVSPNPVTVGLAFVDAFLEERGLAVNDTGNATFTFLPPDRSLGSNIVPAGNPHPGHFAAEGGFFTMPGAWTVRVHVPRTTAYDVVVDFQVEVAG